MFKKFYKEIIAVAISAIALITVVSIFVLADSYNIWDSDSVIGPSVLQWQSLAMSDDGMYISGTVYNGPIYVSSDGGATFTAKANNRLWRGIAMSNDGKYQTACVFGSTTVPGYIYRSTDYGNTWQQVGINKRWLNVGMSKDGMYQTAISYHTAIGGLNGRVLISSDYGATWIEVGALNDRTFGGIAVSESGQHQIISDVAKKVLYSSDYGATWSEILETTTAYVQGLAMSADGVYMTAVEDGGNIWISSDSGATWTEIVNTQRWKDVKMSADGKYQTASSVNTKYMAASNDYGLTWTQVMAHHDLEWTALTMSKDGDVQVVGSYLGGNQSKLFKSTANCVLTYTAGANGTINGATPQTIAYKADGTQVEALPDPNYHFVKWSDDSTDNPRTDSSVIANITVTADFAINQYILTYLAGTGGGVTGTTPQTVDHGTDGTPVSAVPETGYVFVDWTDGVTDNPRTDISVTSDITVTANFFKPQPQGSSSGPGGAPFLLTEDDEEDIGDDRDDEEDDEEDDFSGSAPEDDEEDDDDDQNGNAAEEDVKIAPFSDIHNHWAFDLINNIYFLGYINGYPDNTFRPDQPILRAEAAKLVALWFMKNISNSACNENMYFDVSCDTWYGKYICYLTNKGVLQGYGLGIFAPEKNISRAEALKILIYAKDLLNIDIDDINLPYSDIKKDDWHYQIIAISHKLSIIEGYKDGTFRPDHPITRAEFVKIFLKTLLSI